MTIPQEGMINTVKTCFDSTQDDGQADVPDEPLTVEGALQQMLLWQGASHSCHLLASQIPVSIQDHAWHPMRQHLHSNEQIDGSISWHTIQSQSARSSTDCVAGGIACIHASAQASISIVDIPCSIVYLPEGFH